jgi:hypothetical protein
MLSAQPGRLARGEAADGIGNLCARFLEQSLDPIGPAAFLVDPPLGAIGPAVRDRQLFAQ